MAALASGAAAFASVSAAEPIRVASPQVRAAWFQPAFSTALMLSERCLRTSVPVSIPSGHATEHMPSTAHVSTASYS